MANVNKGSVVIIRDKNVEFELELKFPTLDWLAVQTMIETAARQNDVIIERKFTYKSRQNRPKNNNQKVFYKNTKEQPSRVNL